MYNKWFNNTISGIMVKYLDNQTYFVCFEMPTKTETSNLVKIKKQNITDMTDFYNKIANSDILYKIDPNPTANPSDSFETLNKIVEEAREKDKY